MLQDMLKLWLFYSGPGKEPSVEKAVGPYPTYITQASGKTVSE